MFRIDMTLQSGKYNPEKDICMFGAGRWRLIFNLFVIFSLFCFWIIIFSAPQQTISLIPDISPKQVEGWESNITRETKVYVLPEDDTNIINGKRLCKGSVSLMIIVFSAPGNFAQRSAVRETWGMYNTTTTTVGVAFFVGRSKNSTSQLLIEEENAKFQDVVQEDFMDSYNNLSVKSVLMLKWFLNKCPSSTFLMKTDDDMFINTQNLNALISKFNTSSVLKGSLLCKNKPALDPANKWYTPKYMYSEPFYPDYLSGVAYIMSRDVASKLYTAALSTPLILLEDVYITGICAEKAGIKPQNLAAFSNEEYGTQCYAGMVTNHHLNPQELRQVWNLRNNCSSDPPPVKKKHQPCL